MTSEQLSWLLPLPPLLAFGTIAIFTHRRRALSHSIALIGAVLAWLASLILFWRVVRMPGIHQDPIISTINWMPMGKDWFQISIQVDLLTVATLFFVAWTVLMIFIYSIGYHNYGQPMGEADLPGLPPQGRSVNENGHSHKVPSIEPMYSRFFAFISLFAFAMYMLVITGNLLVLYIAWEIMGLCSYLLIGFWYGKTSARDASVKAFITTRVGDMFMMIGIIALFSVTGTLNYQQILGNPAVLNQLATTPSPVFGLPWAVFIGMMLFFGTVGKSAQFPLHVWLPDAMEGPTPVSAMIHAATMVSAGVYLVIRFFPLISAGWTPGQPLNPTMLAMVWIGTFTAIFTATIAVAQNDIKRVLAYSTISQLGFMIAALGMGAYVAATFHLVTHAFFKALLFLGSGSVIHGMEHGVLHTGTHIDTQDMYNMGGLRKKMPVTFWTFLLGGMALSGLPVITAGFWSKDAILEGTFESGHIFVFIILALTAFLTAFYTMRQITLTFLGEPRSSSAAHASESKPVMTLPLVVLAFFALVIGWIGIPRYFPILGGLIPDFFKEYIGSMLLVQGQEGSSLIPLATSVVVSLAGLGLGWLFYRNIPSGSRDPLQKWLGGFYAVLVNKYYVDEFYNMTFVRFAHWISETFTYRWIDQLFLDGIINGIGRFGLWIGRGLRNKFDLPVINRWFGDTFLAGGTRLMGTSLSRNQVGRLQQYMLTMVIVTLVIAVIFIYFFVLG